MAPLIVLLGDGIRLFGRPGYRKVLFKTILATRYALHFRPTVGPKQRLPESDPGPVPIWPAFAVGGHYPELTLSSLRYGRHGNRAAKSASSREIASPYSAGKTWL